MSKQKGKDKQTEWYGLWKNGGVYSGYTIKKEDIPPYSKIVLRFNKFYKKDSGRPRFQYCFANGDAAYALTVELSDEEAETIGALKARIKELEEQIDELEEQIDDMYTYDQVTSAVRAAAQDGLNGWTDVIASDYL